MSKCAKGTPWSGGARSGDPILGGSGFGGDQTTSTRLSLAVLMSFQGYPLSGSQSVKFINGNNMVVFSQ
jgi:hypothetical protein